MQIRYVKAIIQIFFLYCIYLLGNWIHTTFKLVIPGSIIGMLILFILLYMRLIKIEWLKIGGSLLLAHMTLLFIPATVGIIDYLHLFSGPGFITIIIVLLSTIIVMLSTVMISEFILNRKENKDGEKNVEERLRA
ncbi:CidA/LrgA family holin-like protein [Metabacillus fastidiosus]|uniref:CidA/LrgA family protein n=1 Tax=Metabacillus fastidiosus TaxID=1458 RepID=UPI002DB6821C|nr:CidA/LrgA family holin-like protein [Metabacillus fastidiosus]MEC2077406.1 CidA/LrgA family holin-like protein [Metabacillus fastidiosus]